MIARAPPISIVLTPFRSTILPFCAAAMAALVALATLAGYVVHDASLIGVRRGVAGMSPLTAVGLLILAIGCMAEALDRARAGLAMAWTATLLGSTMLVLHDVWGSDIASPFVASRLFGFDAGHAGRTAFPTAVCIAVLGFAGVVRGRSSVSNALAVGGLSVSGLAMLGYAYGVEDLYRLLFLETMDLHTAGSLFALSVASLSMRPGRGWFATVLSRGLGGVATRRQLAFLAVPPVTGWLLLRVGEAHGVGPAAGMAIQVVVTVVPLAVLGLRDGRALDAERRAKAEMQAELRNDLGRRLTDQVAELERHGVARTEMEAALNRVERMDIVGQFTGGIAHDFNDLLMAIGGNLDQLSRKLPGHHPLHSHVIDASTARERGQKLTGQLLTFSRTRKLNVRPVEIDAVLSAMRDLVGNAVGPRTSLTMRLGTDRAWAAADPDQLELAIINLAINARDAMPTGGWLTIESASGRSQLDDRGNEASYVTVRVADTGAGMLPEVAARAVEPFFTTKDGGKSTGLGLTQVHGFVRQCGGDLRIDSVVGEGTTIELLLPCAEQPGEVHANDQTEPSVAVVHGDGTVVRFS